MYDEYMDTNDGTNTAGMWGGSYSANDYSQSDYASNSYDSNDYSELYSAIDKLPEKLRICISLRYFSDLSCAEISNVLEISVSAVTTRLSRAIKALAKEMNNGGGNSI